MSDQRRYDLNYSSTNKDDKSFILWHYGIVTRIDDPFNAGRIKVRINPIDNDVLPENQDKDPNDGGLPWCEPILPKYVNIVPKVGDLVKIITFDYRNKKIRRIYIGPEVVQQTPVDFKTSEYNVSKIKIENSSYTTAWSTNGEALDGSWKIYPDLDDISFLGRENTDIILRDKSFYNEIVLRTGKIDASSITEENVNGISSYRLNRKNPSYISLNYTKVGSLPDSIKNDIKNLNLQKDRTHINIVSDKINLISHEGSSKKGKSPTIIKGDDIVTQLKTENEKLHPLVYGDMFWEFLNVLRPYVEGHIHKGSRLKPDEDISKNNLIKWFNDNMGSITDKESPDGTIYKEIVNCRFLSKGVKTN
jgi:hypothetical protein